MNTHNKYCNISAAYQGCGLLVGSQHFHMAALIERKPNRISFVAADGLKHHFLNCVINVEEVPAEMTEEIVSPIIGKALTTTSVTLYTANGMILQGPYKNVHNLEFSPDDADFAFTTAEGNRVTMSGGTIVVDEEWVTEVPQDDISNAIKANLPDIVEQLFTGVEDALANIHTPTIETTLTENLPDGFVKHLLDTGNGFTSIHDALRNAAFAALGARLAALAANDLKVKADGKNDAT